MPDGLRISARTACRKAARLCPARAGIRSGTTFSLGPGVLSSALVTRPATGSQTVTSRSPVTRARYMASTPASSDCPVDLVWSAACSIRLVAAALSSARSRSRGPGWPGGRPARDTAPGQPQALPRQ